MSDNDTTADAPSGGGDLLIDVQGLHAGYGGIPVVRDLHLSVGRGEVDLDELALPHRLDARKSERAERCAHRLALRVEHALLQHHLDPRPHRRPRQLISVGRIGCVTAEGSTPSRRASSA